MSEEIKEELLRLRERQHALSNEMNIIKMSVAVLERSEEQLASLQSTIKSLTESVTSNTTAVLQRLTSTERWQESHEKLDEERWKNLDAKLSEMKDMIEAIPVEVGKDLGALETVVAALTTKVTEHETAIERIKTIWATVTVIGGLVFAAAEFFLHMKKG